MDQQEFFSVHHRLTANVELLDNGYTLPDDTHFNAEIPAPFIVASEFSQLDTLTEGAMAELKNSDFKNLMHLIDHQNGKLNLLLTFMLAQQDDQSLREYTTTFGASQFSYPSDKDIPKGTLARVKLFLDHPPAAIYCYTKVIGSSELEDGFEITMSFTKLREADQDLLIKAALYQQQKLLRQRSLEREQK